MDKHVVTRTSVLNLQVCTVGTAEEALEFAQTNHPAGTTHNWQPSDKPELAPVKCKRTSRTHAPCVCLLMPVFYFTFGQIHRHVKTDEPMKDYYVKIHARDVFDARLCMVDEYGRQWCGCYHEEDFLGSMHHYPKGLYKEHFVINVDGKK